MSLYAWTLVPLAVLHVWLARRHPAVFRFQLLLDLVLAAVIGPALVTGGDLNPVRCLEPLPPFTDTAWSVETERQPTQSDVVIQFHPWWEETRRQLRWGMWPLIQPGVGAGLPLLANGQTGLWAPMMLPVWLHGPERGTTIMALWKIELAGVGAFLLMLGRRVRWVAAAVGGLGWAGSPYLVGWLLVPLAWVVALLPWVWMAVRWCLEGNWWRALAVGLGCGWLMGSGLHPETAAVVCGSALLMGLIDTAGRWRRLLTIVVVAGFVAITLSWPTIGLIRSSSRQALVAGGNLNRAPFPARVRNDLVCQAVVPAVKGHPGRGDWRADYPQAPGATGVGGLLLALVAAGSIAARHRRLAWAAVAATAIGAVLLFRLPPLDAVLVRLPPLDQMTLPRFGVLIPWGLVVLASLAVDGALGGGRRATSARLIPALFVAAAVLWAAPWRLAWPDAALVGLSMVLAVAGAWLWRRRWLPIAVAAELALLAVGINPVAATADRLPRPTLVQRLEELTARNPARIVGLERVLPPNLASRYGLRDLRASDPLRPQPFTRLLGVFGEPATILGGPLTRAPTGLCGAWGVGYAVTRPRRELADWTAVYAGPDGRIWSNPRLLEEVRVVGRTTVAPDDPTRLAEVADAVDFEETVLVPAGAPPVAADRLALDVLLRQPVRIDVMAECDGPCLVVVAQPWAPGWRVSVDRHRAEIVLTNVAGLGTVIPAGRHRVEFAYHPWKW